MKKIIVISLVLLLGISSYTWSNEVKQDNKALKERHIRDLDKANKPIGMQAFTGMMSPKKLVKLNPCDQCVIKPPQNQQ